MNNFVNLEGITLNHANDSDKVSRNDDLFAIMDYRITIQLFNGPVGYELAIDYAWLSKQTTPDIHISLFGV